MVSTVDFKVTEVFLTRLLGTAPADKEVYERFIASKRAKEEERRRRASERLGVETAPVVGTEVEEIDTVREEPGVTMFHNDLGQTTEDGQGGKGLFLFDYQCAGFWKEAAETLQDEHGIKMVRSKLDNFMSVHPRRVYITDQQGKVLTSADGRLERPLRAMTMQGPRVSLACSEVVNPGRTIQYTLRFLPYLKSGSGREAKRIDLAPFVQSLAELAELKGRGQWRTGGNGRMRVKVETVKE